MRDLGAGMRYLGRGQRWVFGHGRWFGFGLLPALVTLVLYAGALTALAFYADDIASWATPFADGWDELWRDLLRGLFAVLVWLAGLLLSVLTFTAVTLIIGDPFYEKLSEQVEESEGGAPAAPDRPLWLELWTSLCDSLYVLYRMLLYTVPLFFLGFLPAVGQTVVPVLGFCVSGFFLTLELVSVAMQRRGIPVKERLRLLRTRRGLALGFGVPLVLAFLVPLVAVVLMPGAVAGAALLVRDIMGENEDQDARRDDGRLGGGDVPLGTDPEGAPSDHGANTTPPPPPVPGVNPPGTPPVPPAGPGPHGHGGSRP